MLTDTHTGYIHVWIFGVVLDYQAMILTLVSWILDNNMFSSCVKVHIQLTFKSLITFLTIVHLLTLIFIYFEFLNISIIWCKILTLVTHIYFDTFMFGYFVFLRFCLLELWYSHWSLEDWTPSCLYNTWTVPYCGWAAWSLLSKWIFPFGCHLGRSDEVFFRLAHISNFALKM